jgi:hypothetical protein
MSARFWLAAVALAAVVSGGARADDVKLLGGAAPDAKTQTLQGSPETDADTLEVFHGRILRWLCHKPYVGYYAPAYSYSCFGCTGCFGCYGGGCFGGGYTGCFGCYGGGCYGGMGYAGPSYGSGYASPNYYGYAPPAPSYSPSAPAMGVYGSAGPVATPSTSVTVTTPRFALSIGSGSLIIGRAALTTGRLTGPTARPIDAPPSEHLPTPRTRPESYRYDGGPARPVPMPGDRPPDPTLEDEGPALPPVINRTVVATTKKAVYPAYGEQSPRRAAQPPVSNLVKNRGQ